VLALAAAALTALVAAGLGGCGSRGPGGSVSAKSGTARAAGTAGAGPGTAARPRPAPPPPPPQLPLGGRRLLPDYRVVAHYGTAGTGALGILGQGSPEQAAGRVAAAAAPFAQPGRPAQPAMELIASVATSFPGPDGHYSRMLPAAEIEPYYRAAHRHRELLVLDLQPGQADFLTQARAYEPFLIRPDVGLAVDAEWKMDPGVVPGRAIGHTDAATLNQVSAWLAGLARSHRLPQKLFVIHQFTASMITNRPAVVAWPELATVLHVDGFGGQEIKKEKYAQLAAAQPLADGIKLFLTQDDDMMSPAQALALRPQPDLITYQ